MADDLPEELARMVEWGKDMKEDRVADASTMEDESLPPVLQFLRSGEPIAVCFCPQVSRDAALQAAKIGVPGYSADELFVMLDTYAATNTFEAEFGRRPDPGELQRLYEQGRTDLVTEQLTLIRTTKAFKQSHVFLDYEVERSAMPRRIHWSEEDQGSGTARSGQPLPMGACRRCRLTRHRPRLSVPHSWRGTSMPSSGPWGASATRPKPKE